MLSNFHYLWLALEVLRYSEHAETMALSKRTNDALPHSQSEALFVDFDGFATGITLPRSQSEALLVDFDELPTCRHGSTARRSWTGLIGLNK
jgi:hypothetical protein